MNKERLRKLLDTEVSEWSQKTYDHLILQLPDVVAYERGDGADFHQFEVQALERTDAYVHVSISIDDGGLWRFISPITTSFVVYRDGRVDK